MKFRKKPIEVEAVRNDGTWEPICQWLQAFVGAGNLIFLPGQRPPITRQADGSLSISTLEGVMRANVGDWVIRGVKGELYPCKPDIFEATYEPVP